MRQLVAYFLTFSCYGSHLHGDAPYSVDRRHNVVDGPYLAALPGYRRASLGAMEQEPYELDEQRRCMVLEAIRNVCQFAVSHAASARVGSGAGVEHWIGVDAAKLEDRFGAFLDPAHAAVVATLGDDVLDRAFHLQRSRASR